MFAAARSLSIKTGKAKEDKEEPAELLITPEVREFELSVHRIMGMVRDKFPIGGRRSETPGPAGMSKTLLPSRRGCADAKASRSKLRKCAR